MNDKHRTEGVLDIGRVMGATVVGGAVLPADIAKDPEGFNGLILAISAQVHPDTPFRPPTELQMAYAMTFDLVAAMISFIEHQYARVGLGTALRARIDQHNAADKEFHQAHPRIGEAFRMEGE